MQPGACSNSSRVRSMSSARRLDEAVAASLAGVAGGGSGGVTASLAPDQGWFSGRFGGPIGASTRPLGRYIWLQNDAYTVSLEEIDDIAVIRMGVPPWVGRQTAELSLGVAVRTVRDLLGETWRPQEARFTHPAPARLDMHRKVFGRT